MDFPERLLAGYRAFRANRLPVEQQRFRELAESGQQPEVMVIGCCDSRVSPEAIFDAGPGELFVVRNVANLVPPYTPTGLTHGVSAALEFAVEALKVKHIVVLGHARCGGIRAFAAADRPLSPGDFIGKWMSLIQPAAATLGPRGQAPLADYLTRLEQASIRRTLASLRSFPFVAAALAAGRLAQHGAYFDVATGLLSLLDETCSEFRPAAGPCHSVNPAA
ncbi:MAG: carbonic anhydrase [Alphaproteobacteria bacterium]|nr:carbonic anhydrase [Alphaproteobacteria bacterium]